VRYRKQGESILQPVRDADLQFLWRIARWPPANLQRHEAVWLGIHEAIPLEKHSVGFLLSVLDMYGRR